MVGADGRVTREKRHQGGHQEGTRLGGNALRRQSVAAHVLVVLLSGVRLLASRLICLLAGRWIVL